MPLEKRLKGKRVAIFAEDLYEDLELWYPLLRLREEGAEVVVVGSGESREHHGKYGYPVAVDKAISEVDVKQFDGVVVPGGYAPDRMRRHAAMVAFIREMARHGKIVAAICHGPWMLASACVLEGKTITSFFSVKDDMINAGAKWVDRPVVVSDNIITSRSPADLPEFMPALLKALGA